MALYINMIVDHLVFGRIQEKAPMALNKDEVSEVRWATFDQLASILESSKNTLTPWFHMIASILLSTNQGWNSCASLDARTMEKIISNKGIVKLSQ